MKIHHKIIHHVKKHHKKYIFWAGVAFGISALKLVLITGIFIGIQTTAGRSNAANEELKVYKVTQILDRINEIANEEAEESEKESPFSEEAKKIFYELDKQYHSTEDIHEEYIATKKMVDFLADQEKYRPEVDEDEETDSERDQEYRELLLQFYQIR